MKERILSISEAAKQLGVETHVLRYWEEELDIEIPRNEMGHRLYGAREMQMLHSVKELKVQGFQLRAIKLLMHEWENGEEMDIDKIVAMREDINRRVEAMNHQDAIPKDTRMFPNGPAMKPKENKPYQIEPEKREEKQYHLEHKKDKEAYKQYIMKKVEEDFAGYHPTDVADGRAYMPQDGKVRASMSSYPNNIAEDANYMPMDYRGQYVRCKEPQPNFSQFQYAMVKVMNNALQENTEVLTAEMKNILQKSLSEELTKCLAGSMEQVLGDHISDEVSTRVIKEMNYLTRMQEEREEAYFQQISSVLGIYQEGMKECASARQRKKMKKKEAKMLAAANMEEKKSSKGLFGRKK